MAPARIARWAIIVIDLLAALPSIVIALWGAFVFTPVAASWGKLLNQYFGSIPFFKNEVDNYYRSPFIGGWILAIMMIPIITSVSREVISRVDKELVNASYALGATRFSAMRRVILPTARGGILGGILLGVGRGLGETIAILYTINLIFQVNVVRILENRGGAVAPMIASFYGEAESNAISALLAAGVVLFGATLIVNMFATYIVQRSEKKMAS
jgi:phosphate transport system permease protein